MNTAASGEGTPPMHSMETTDTPGWRANLVRWPKGLILGIRLSEADVQDLLSEARDERFIRFLGGFIQAANSITPLLPYLPAEALLRFVQMHWLVEQECQDFVEPTVDPVVRPLLYLSALGIRALHATNTPLDRADDLLDEVRADWTSHSEFFFPLATAYGLLRGRDIEAELFRRGSVHLGVWVAMLNWASRLEDSDEAVKAVLDKLRAMAWRTTRQRLSRVDSSGKIAQMKTDFSADITMLVLSRWGSISPDQAMIRALEGCFDIVVTAIADAVVKKTRRELQNRKVKAGIRTAHESLSKDRAWRARLHPAAIAPLGRKLLDAYVKGARTEQEVAKILRVSDRTVRNWLKKLGASYPK